MELKSWKLEFKKGWGKYFEKFDQETQKKIYKKLEQMEQPLQSRGLTSLKFKVEEIGQYRIAFIENEQTNTKYIHFIGNHKQYEKWYKEQ